MAEHFADRLQAACQRCGTAAVVGIDPVLEKLPEELRPTTATIDAAAAAVERFSGAVVDAVAGLVPAVKLNVGFFEAFRGPGLAAYFRSVAYAQQRGLLVIGDIKRGDIGSTAELYARGHFETPAATDEGAVPDAVTLAGYLGENAVQPFIEIARRTGRGVYVLVRPSEPKADEVHDFYAGSDAVGARFYQHMANLVHRWGQAPDLVGQCGWSCVGAVVAPKDRQSTAELRAAMPHTPWLVPGYGAQGGTADDCRACFRRDGTGAVVNASRSVIYAYQTSTARERYGADWRAAIHTAAEVFVADVAGIMQR